MSRNLNEVVVIDAVRTAFGRAGEKSIFWKTRAECLVSGGVEHMGHLPMGFMRDPHPRSEEIMGDESAFDMGMTAENIHDRYPEFTKEMADAYAVESQRKADEAIRAGKMKGMIIPIEVELADGRKIVADKDQQPRPDTTMEALASLKTPFRKDEGRVTAGNASGLNDGAAAVLLMNVKDAHKLGLKPRLRWVSSGVAAVDPRVMGIAPVPATERALERAGLSMDDIDIIEINEAFAVQALYCLDRFGLKPDARVNVWGGSIAYGHPLAASGPRLVAFLIGLFEQNPGARYGLTTMCVGRGQGYSIGNSERAFEKKQGDSSIYPGRVQ